MGRLLVVCVPNLTEGHRQSIRAAAEGHGFEVCFFEKDAQALDAACEAEIIFTQSTLLLQNAPKLRWLCTPSAGVNHFTPPGVFPRERAVLSNSSGAYGVTIAEHIIMVSLELMRKQHEYNQIVSRREWKRDLPVSSIHGCRITLAGTGNIGQEAAVRLRAFSPASLTGVNRSGRNPDGLFDRVVKQDKLREILPSTDLLILSVPGTAETNHMMDREKLSLLPDGAILINVGRGNAIDQKALENELRQGRLFAALDVFEEEPVPPSDPLWDCPNLLITPHVAGNMTLPYTRERIVAMFLEDFDHYCSGAPLERSVDLDAGY